MDGQTPSPASRRDAMLDRLGEVVVRIGLNLGAGQELVITGALDAAGLVRRITEHAYKAGATLVTTFFTDEIAKRARFRHAADASFDTAASWLADGIAQAFRGNAARLAVTGEDPALLSGEDPERIARANRGMGSSFTVRKISFGEGVERVFPLYSPNVDSIDVVRRGVVRRAKLYYLRGRTGKSARIAERKDNREKAKA